MSFFKKIFSSDKKEQAISEEAKQTLDKGLEKSKTSFFSKLTKAVAGKSKVDAEVLDNLEEILVSSDVGVNTTLKIIERIEERVSRDKYLGTDELNGILREEIAGLLSETNSGEATQFEIPANTKPYVIMVVGVNGVGKTTTIGKLSNYYRLLGHKVMIAAGDTFRAAAAEQLKIWGERAEADVVSHAEGADPAAVVYDAVKAAVARKADILFIDTAGRLHNKSNLMKELDKIHRVIQREIPDAPHETLLVLDATTGQNAITQAKIFTETTNVTGVVLTKLDGTAKGGVIIAIKEELGLSVKWIGVGESIMDFRPFEPDKFVEALFNK